MQYPTPITRPPPTRIRNGQRAFRLHRNLQQRTIRFCFGCSATAITLRGHVEARHQAERLRERRRRLSEPRATPVACKGFGTVEPRHKYPGSARVLHLSSQGSKAAVYRSLCGSRMVNSSCVLAPARGARGVSFRSTRNSSGSGMPDLNFIPQREQKPSLLDRMSGSIGHW